jgi:putative hydrolase
VSDPDPSGENPFKGVPFLGDLAKMLQGQGAINWDAARQFALMIATEGASPINVDPAVRFKFQELGRIAELHVQTATGLDLAIGGRAVEVVPVTAAMWAQRSLDDYHPLFEHLAGALSGGGSAARAAELETAGDPQAAMMNGLMQMMAPMMLGMSAGSMVGHLSRRCFGQYDLPIPRPASSELMVVADTIERFGADWSLPIDDLRLWVCLQELTLHAVLTVPHVRSELEHLLTTYVAGFRPDPEALADQLGSIDITGGDEPGNELQQMFANPEALLGAVQSAEQRALLPRLDALVAVVVGFVDHTLDHTARGLIGSSQMIGEAVRRRRVEADQSDVFVERLLGLTLTRTQVERGSAFVAGVLERGGDLSQLWSSSRALPTPAEVDAPGLWLARLELPD